MATLETLERIWRSTSKGLARRIPPFTTPRACTTADFQGEIRYLLRRFPAFSWALLTTAMADECRFSLLVN